MAKKTTFTLHSDLSVEQLHTVLSSQRYLLTKDEMEDAHKADIIDTHYEVRDDNVVTSRVKMQQVRAGDVEQQGEAAGEGEQQAPPPLVIEQTTHVTPLGSDKKGTGFRMSTIMPLPGGMGSVFTDMDMTPDPAAAGNPSQPGTDAHVEVRVDINIPLIGGKLAKQLLGNSEETVSKGLRRAARLAE